MAVVRDDACGRVAAVRLWEHPGCFSVTREITRRCNSVLVRISIDLSRRVGEVLRRVDLNLLSSEIVSIGDLKDTQGRIVWTHKLINI